ncbi:MAG: hypothetical protein H7836_02615, partial [Magnetococcus sp. YQC-3]
MVGNNLPGCRVTRISRERSGGLLQGFQEGVGRRLVHGGRIIHDRHLPGSLQGGQGEKTGQLSHLIHADPGLAFRHDHPG